MLRAAKALAIIFLLAGLFSSPLPGRAQAGLPAPGAPGPFAVPTDEYNLGDTAFKPHGFPNRVEMHASVHYPANLADSAGKNFPLIIFLHGVHVPCVGGPAPWPCVSPVPNYQGYDYAAELLASYGYIVVSVSANGIT